MIYVRHFASQRFPLLVIAVVIIMGALKTLVVAEYSLKNCSELDWDAYAYGVPDVCGGSKLPSRSSGKNNCSGLLSWEEAKEFCERAGARLCALDELLNDEARRSGCFYDKKLVWSSSLCIGTSESENDAFHALGYGSTKRGHNTSCRGVSELGYVRCCADVSWARQLPPPIGHIPEDGPPQDTIDSNIGNGTLCSVTCDVERKTVGQVCTCIALYSPVCGCDGIVYSNSCHAQCAGVSSWKPVLV